ncbi:hypothetical protein KBX73_08675 [Acetobacter persici]|uniref:Uncharacterized protein n=1 Tax=Acetobacter senegalensis TaxID=446692 RepID=A0A0U5EUP3_9PROT|nr:MULTISPECIES: hypothetical protein [Acetobacter]MCP9319840.1 hypothetical protein [Acetobacter persici]CEF40199.1 hypothetical protein ASN_796 [Acetobacter senegalensis]
MVALTKEQWLGVLSRLQPYGMTHVSDIEIFSNIDRDILRESVTYLASHGLIISYCQESCIGNHWSWGGVQLTAKGVDYLSEDGGLTAEDKTITVKLDGDTIKALLCKAVDETSAPDATKTGIKQQVRAMGSEALKDLTSSLISKGVESAPDVIQWLGTALG